MDANKLKEILDKHSKWLRKEEGGERANLSEANLSRANLFGANLTRANLSEADLTRADLSWAYLSEANLSRANLFGANLTGAYLTEANLSRANLSVANLSGAYLSGADLTRAGLTEANLKDVKNMPCFQIVPESGSFVGWKKLQNDVIAELLIPAKAARVSSTGRKCRAEFVKVIELIGSSEAFDKHTGKTLYKVGKTIKPDKWDADIRVECTHGIHFFLTKKEAEEY